MVNNISAFIFSLGGFLLGLTCTGLLVILFIYGKTKLHRLWTLFNLAVAIWGFGSFFIGRATTEQMGRLSWRFSFIGVIFIAILFFHVCCEFTKVNRKKILIFAYLQGFFYEIVNWTPLYISELKLVLNSIWYIRATSVIFHLSFFIWLGLVVYGHYELFRFFLKSKGIRRNQVLYLFLGFIVGFSGGTTNFFPMFGINIYPYGNFTIPLYCIIVTYAILKYRVMNISIAVTRTGIFVMMYSLVLGMPFIVTYTSKSYLIAFFSDKWWLVPMGLLTVLATAGPFIFIYINKKAEGALLREQKKYQHTLRHASSGMIRIRDLRKLLNLIVYVVTKTVRIEFASVFMLNSENNHYSMVAQRGLLGFSKDYSLEGNCPFIHYLYSKREPIVYEEVQLQSQDGPSNLELACLERQLKEFNAAVLIPSFVGNNLLGFILLGKKLSGKAYSQDDLNVFSVLANQAALAIENAQFFEDVKETQAQLLQAEKMATIGTMANGLSHQMNNRLNALGLIAADTLDTIKLTDIKQCPEQVKGVISQIKHALERIEANVHQGGEIVRGLLKYSRTGPTGMEDISLDFIVNSALEMAQYKVKLEQFDLVRNYSKDGPLIKGNPSQLQEVFFNFIDNAYDAIVERRDSLKEPDYRGKIEISSEKMDSFVRIVIQDNGIGVAKENHKRLFTPFFTTKVSSRKGTGLGLYVIQRIITQNHMGRVSVSSEYKRGTRFVVELPLAR